MKKLLTIVSMVGLLTFGTANLYARTCTLKMPLIRLLQRRPSRLLLLRPLRLRQTQQLLLKRTWAVNRCTRL